uniref:Uncharacterized protein n=1 Tax=Cacopsylla melanoneura TaxID=428564 RepID=A0A8D9BGX7_9HEMI
MESNTCYAIKYMGDSCVRFHYWRQIQRHRYFVRRKKKEHRSKSVSYKTTKQSCHIHTTSSGKFCRLILHRSKQNKVNAGNSGVQNDVKQSKNTFLSYAILIEHMTSGQEGSFVTKTSFKIY